MSRRKLVLFDIDGTILLSRGAGRRAVLSAMADLLPPVDSVRGLRFDGKTDPQIVVELLAAAGDPDAANAERVTRILERYVTMLEQELARPDHVTDVMPGVRQVLDRIEEAGDAVLGLLTGNVRPGAQLKLRSAAIDPDRFPVGAFGSDHPVRAELPPIAAARAEPHFGRRPAGAEIVIIGDTPADVTCGASVGARAIGVATGGYTSAQLVEAGAYAVFEDLSDLDRVWQAIWS